MHRLPSVGLLICASISSSPLLHADWNSNWDGIGKCIEQNQGVPQQECKHRARVIRHLILVRHGQYHTESEDKFLTDLGKHQAKLAGQRIVRIVGDRGKIQRFVSSTMNRAVETAEIVKGEIEKGKGEGFQLEHIKDEVLCEGRPIEPEPAQSKKSEDECATERIEEAFRKLFFRSCNTVCMENVEGDKAKYVEEFEIVIAHANVIRYLMLRALQLDPKAWLRLSLHHGSITWLRITPTGNVSLRSFGDYGHTPEEQASTR
jgi:serine/threonine-protein phosphatase PGAM5